MKFGITIFPTDETLGPVELAREAERRGFDSLWFPEHSHIPISRETPWPGGADLPEKYRRAHEQFVALGAAAAVTHRITLGTGVTLLAQRDPIWTAKQVASLDVISGGRLLFGIGYGWNREEMASHGIAYEDRRDLLREKLLLMRSLWTEEVASLDGEHVSLEPSWAWPKPVQQPHPPVIMGASIGPRTLAHIVEFCDGWIPTGGGDVAAGTIAIRRALEDAGRDPSGFRFVYYGASRRPERLEAIAELGFDHAVFAVESNHPDRVIERLESIQAAIAAYRS